MLATVDQLSKYLHTAGVVAGGAAIDPELLGLMLDGASDRLSGLVPDRTLERLPAGDADDPVELAFAIPSGHARVFQVPDLRTVASIRVDDGPALDAAAYTLRRRPRERCALWVKLRTPAVGRELRIAGHWGPAGLELRHDADELVAPRVRDACLVWAARAFHNRTARFADSAQDPSGGVSSYFRNLPPDVKLVADGLRVPGL